MKLLETIELDIGYPSRKVLSNINLTLDEGELVCFMGPNGAGKSTLLRTLCGFQKELRGNVHWKGISIHDMSRRDRARFFSVVLTDKIPTEYMTGRELVTLGRHPYTNWHGKVSSEDSRAIEEALEVTSADGFADQWLFELSDGQRQKLFIARALAQKTPVIILDEPTAHLDLNNRVAIINLLKDLAKGHNRAVLMATHELDLALQRADKLWLANPGGTISTGMPEDMVLNGEIDKVFEFKGYDLKTGQVEPPVAQAHVNLLGSGSIYLWTKNALERNGIGVKEEANLTIKIPEENSPLEWQAGSERFHSLEALISHVWGLFV